MEKHGHTSQPSTKTSKQAKPYSCQWEQHDEFKGSGIRSVDIWWRNRLMDISAKNALRRWINDEMQALPEGSQFLFIRVSLKRAIRNKNDIWIWLTRQLADQTMKVLFDRVNRKLFGAAEYDKGRQKLWLIDCHEGDSAKRDHRHLLVHVPTDQCPQALEELFADQLREREWVFGASKYAFKIERAKRPSAVVRYITKTGGDSVSLESWKQALSSTTRRVAA